MNREHIETIKRRVLTEGLKIHSEPKVRWLNSTYRMAELTEELENLLFIFKIPISSFQNHDYVILTHIIDMTTKEVIKFDCLEESVVHVYDEYGNEVCYYYNSGSDKKFEDTFTGKTFKY